MANNLPGFGYSGRLAFPKINQPSAGLLPATPQPTASSVQFFSQIWLCRLSETTYQLRKTEDKAPMATALTGNRGGSETTCFSRPVTLEFNQAGTHYAYRFTLHADPGSPTLVGPTQLQPEGVGTTDLLRNLAIGDCLSLTNVRGVVTSCLLG